MTMAQIKGTGMVNVIKGLKVQADDSLQQLPDSLRHYLKEQILVASWYPADDFIALLQYLCKILPPDALRSTPGTPPTQDPWEWMGRRCAAIDLVEIYSSMLQYGRPWRTLERFPRLWRLYFDTGRAEVAIAGDQAARVELSNFPFAVHENYCRHLAGYLFEAMHLAGAQGTEIDVLNTATATEPARWSIQWQG